MNDAVFKHNEEDKEWVDPYPKKKRMGAWVTGIFVALVLYVLSVGPVILLRQNFEMGQPWTFSRNLRTADGFDRFQPRRKPRVALVYRPLGTQITVTAPLQRLHGYLISSHRN